MQFELTQEYVAKLRQAIQGNDEPFVTAQIKELHTADIAEIFNDLELEDAKYLYKHYAHLPALHNLFYLKMHML